MGKVSKKAVVKVSIMISYNDQSHRVVEYDSNNFERFDVSTQESLTFGHDTGEFDVENAQNFQLTLSGIVK